MSEADGWSRGYPVRESYPPSWHGFQSPAHLKLVCAINGVAWDADAHSPLCMAEVGCGTGYTALMLAAGNPNAQVYGLDYNPAHIAEARELAEAAGLRNAHFLEADVSELAQPGSALLERLPDFDLVTAHGLWSWVADDVRQGLLALLQARLKPGGLAMVSYNALPGAAGALGLSRLVRQGLDSHADTAQGLAAAGSLVQRLVAAEAQQLPPSNWRRMLSGEVPGVRLGYLLHEFSTRHWRPSFQADVAAAMDSVRCDYVGSASLAENFPHMSLSPAQRVLWDEAPDRSARELIFDLCVPRPFRRDVYVRGLRRVSRDAVVRAMPFVLLEDTQEDTVLQTQQGEARLPADLMDGVRAALARGPRSIGHLLGLPGSGQVTPCELAAVLAGSACAVPLWREPGQGEAWQQQVAVAQRLNAVVAQRLAPHGIGGMQFGLATPLLGGGLQVSALELALAVRLAAVPRAGRDAVTVEALVEQLLPPDLHRDDASVQELRSAVASILGKRVPAWTALGLLAP